MGLFGRSFINVMFPRFEWMSGRSSFSREAVTNLPQLLRTLIAELQDRGGIIYFPTQEEAGPYILGPDGTGNIYTIPAPITLKFAPGAMIQLVGSAVLQIGGGIDAGPFPIFGDQRPLVGPRMTTFLPPLNGRVVLTSDRIPFVRPEWFGALGVSGDSAGSLAYDASQALQAAIDAAVILRGDRPSIPILVESNLVVSRPLVVGPEIGQGPPLSDDLRMLMGASNPLILRGTHGIGTANLQSGQLLASSNFGSGQAPGPNPAPPLLTIKGERGVDVSNVQFGITAQNPLPSQQRAAAAVLIELPRSDQQPPRGTRVLRFSHCTFNGGRVASVAIVGPFTDPDAGTPTRPTKVLFEQCFFDAGGGGDAYDPPSPSDPWITPRSVFVRGPSSLTVDLETSNFQANLDRYERSRAFVHAEGGAVILEGCTFHSTNNSYLRTVPMGVTRGQDVALERPGVGERDDADLRTLIPAGLREPATMRPELVPTALTMLQCESQSLSLLARAAVVTEGRREARRLHRNAVLVGTRHSAVIQGQQAFPATRAPSSILWRSVGGPMDATLVLVSSRFNHEVEVSRQTLRGSVVSAACSWVEGAAVRLVVTAGRSPSGERTVSVTILDTFRGPFFRREGTDEAMTPLRLRVAPALFVPSVPGRM